SSINTGNPSADVGKWLTPNSTFQSATVADKSGITYNTSFNLGSGTFDPASATMHLKYTFWVEDYYDPNNLIWAGGHTAYAVLNGTRVNDAAILRFGNWSSATNPQFKYQVLEL